MERREIKFRIFFEGKMIYDNESIRLWSMPIVGDRIYCMGISKPDAILMQYTGLKDRNDKEAYEGDVVGDEYSKFKIVWTKAKFDFKYLSGAIQYPYFADNLSRMEIFGNVHENPEFLK